MPFNPDQLPDLSGKIYIVTGGNSGMGYHTVSQLAQHGAHVYMCARSVDKGNAAIASIKKTLLPVVAHISLLQLDLSDLSQVVAAAKHFRTLETSLHGLVNNAGIMATPYHITKDGYEAQWQTNYLSHWVFTETLLPLMLTTASASPKGSVRIVNITSSGHLWGPRCGINFEDLSMKDAAKFTRYGQSKLANILYTKTLHRRYGPGSGGGEIWVSSVHPGMVTTGLDEVASQSVLGRMGIFSLFHFLGVYMAADKGAWTSVYCAASPAMTAEESGAYQDLHKRVSDPSWTSKAAKDEKLRVRLEEWTREAMRREGWVE